MQVAIEAYRESALERRIVLFHVVERIVNLLVDVVLLGILEQVVPAVRLFEIEHVFLGVKTRIVDEILRIFVCKESLTLRFELVIGEPQEQ